MPNVESVSYPSTRNGKTVRHAQRDHQIVTGENGSETLVSFGRVAAIRVPPLGNTVLPPDWHTVPRAAAYYRSAFLGFNLGEIRSALKFPDSWVSVSPSPLPLPPAWLEVYGPDTPEPYTVEDHPAPYVSPAGDRFTHEEAPYARGDLDYQP